MTLKPLGLKDSLMQPTSLGNDFKLQRSLSPLCQSLNPLGQSLQPFGNSVLQPLGEVNKNGEIGNWRLDAGTQIREEGENFAGGIPQFFDNQLPIRARPEINSNLGEIPNTQDFVGNFPTNYRSKKEPLSPNAAALNSPNAARENIAQLKPLAISKPLAQASVSEISSLSSLPQFTQRQSTSSSENLVSTSRETSSLSNSMPTSTVDISNNLSPIVSAKPANNISSSDSLDLPQISRFNDTFLGFNNQLSSQSITKPLPQPQTSFSSKLSLDRESLPSSFATNMGEVNAIAPTSPNLIQSKFSSVPPQETISLQPETRAAKTEDLTAKADGQVDAIGSTSSNLIQAQANSVLSQEPRSLQLESIGKYTENLTNKTEAERDALAPASSNLIQAKPSPGSSQETVASQREINREQAKNLTPKTEGEVETAPSSANLIQSKPSPVPTQETEGLTAKTEGEVEAAPSSANLIQSKPSPVPTQETESLTSRTDGEVEAAPSSANLIQSKPSPVPIQETEGLTAKTDGEVDATPISANLIQSKPSSVPTQEAENLTPKTDGEVDAVSISPNLIQSKPSPVPTQEAESLTAKADGEVEAAPISPNLIQAKSLPSSSLKNTSPPLENFRENRDNVGVISPKDSSEISSDTISSSQTNLVQARSDSPNFYPVQPLGNSKFLAQSSDLFLSDFVTNAADKQPTTSQETSLLSSGSPPNISNLLEEDFPNIYRTNDTESPNNSAKVENIPNSWSSISELLGENTNNAPANIDSFKPLGFSQRLNNPNNSMWAQLEDKYTNNNEQKNNTFDTPTSWSNISELLGETSTTTPDSIPIENEVPPASLPEPESSPSYTFASPNVSDNSTSTTSGETSQPITADILGKDRAVDDEELEKLAQKVYTLMRQWLEIEQERQGYQSLGYPTWLSNITSTYGTSAKVRSAPERSTPGSPPAGEPGEVSPVDDKLQKLTGEIYYLVRQRLEINRERQGGYYTTRLY